MQQPKRAEKFKKPSTKGHKQTDNTTRVIIVHESVKNGTSQANISRKADTEKVE
ncbi:hypothetical protein PHYBLDRAFT_149733 [Phycomyces blakesleeanus NRRL 1555(-)]|uniref:Homeodomain-like DNA binding domain-containing transcription factor n=1 Tax=Phycomyces blakesleeanus (strain ATCC 8743b / DSM 1359 / FGSC 10004 / NBRC 33097 / NRRL 1555) TaxID=763407 RepID=A0A167L105_PHYB8|nr:hypothetical protein PHYBLDRAFT_149733 [Phycomyces blakesleeanus NRRL 1555(-)]OAD69338.1 hypothetical protein PHYBLDRAFT_149733 [Phycomyces blakesleeanus NRRL 1555(-)]|eukprot:XP_018287378.1 hypothetical protein PHYBLDRAFT_149733 [Phycomyces blakesleeanus NRRL 1555(-)]